MNEANLSLVIEKTRQLISDSGCGPVMVHTSLQGVMRLMGHNLNLEPHIEAIQMMAKDRDIWVSSFDEQWVDKKKFSVLETPTTVGVINELFRKNFSSWRTEVPLASFCGFEREPILEVSEIIDIYGCNSIFGKLANNDGVILHYGSGFCDTTYLHYLEQVTNKPPYRFDKSFSGILCDRSGIERSQTVTFHCRPIDRHLNYNWSGLEVELIDAGAVVKIENQLFRIVIISAKKMLSYCVEKLKCDSLYFLDQASLNWVVPMLDKLGRRFQQVDFE